MRDTRFNTAEVTDEEGHVLGVTTHLEYAYLIEFSDIGEHAINSGCVLWGIVGHDNRGWLAKSDYVCTSRIVAHLTDTFYRTLNSVYVIKTPPEKITLPLASLPSLRKGIHPMQLVLEGSAPSEMQCTNIDKSKPDTPVEK
jgi:hypothetical protein